MYNGATHLTLDLEDDAQGGITELANDLNRLRRRNHHDATHPGGSHGDDCRGVSRRHFIPPRAVPSPPYDVGRTHRLCVTVLVIAVGWRLFIGGDPEYKNAFSTSYTAAYERIYRLN